MAVEENQAPVVAPEQDPAAPARPVMAAASARARRPWTLESAAHLLLLAALLLGALFRFTGLDWDGNHHLHPDERFLTSVATALRPVYDPIVYLRTSESPLNPYNAGHSFYVYGNFPMTATRLIAEWVRLACDNLGEVCRYNFAAYDGIHLAGRFLAGLLDLLAVLFTFYTGRRLYGSWAGALAALLYALAVLPIQQSHFFTMDTWAGSLTVLTMYAAVRASEADDGPADGRGGYGWWLAFGLFLGLAVASRINMAPLAAMAPVAAAVWLARRAGQGAPMAYVASAAGSVDVQRAALGLMLAAAVAIATFRVAQPYAFMDSQLARQTAQAEGGEEPGALTVALKSIVGFNPQWRNNMAEIQRLQSPDASFPPALQWTDRAPLLFPLTNMILYGLGLTAGAAGWLAFLWALWRIMRGRPDWQAHALPVAWVALYFLFMGTRWVKSVRYFLPIYPFLFMLAGWALVELWRRAGQGQKRVVWRRAAAGAVAGLVVLSSLLWANAFTNIYRQPLTRVAASEWLFDNAPTGATLLYEAAGQPRELFLPLKGYVFHQDSLPLTLAFALPEDGMVTGVRFNYLQDGDFAFNAAADQETLLVRLTDLTQATTLAEQSRQLNLGQEKEAVEFELAATRLAAGLQHLVVVRLESGGPVAADTSRIVNEHWDDLLPVSLDGRAAYSAYYAEVTGGQRPLTHLDSEEKRQEMLAWIDEADYIALSSQRALWSVPRLPASYPLTIRYYDALFSGELGFDLVAQFHADLRIGPLFVSDTGGRIGWGAPPEIGWPPPGDLAAEEAFSVYDHPPVWIFAKRDDYDPQRAAALLGSVDLSQVMFMTPGQATRAPNGLMLPERLQEAQQANGTFNEIFAVDGPLNRSPALAAAVWWLAVVALGWLAFPITFTVLRGLPDRGFALARILALLFISYFGWLLASLRILPNTRGTLLLGLAVMVALSGWLLARRRKELLGFVRRNLSLLAIFELVGLILYLLFILVRLRNPDVWDVIWGGEKPMDLAYFNAVLKSTYFPPYDPWFAGGYINYYYYGFVYVGALTKLLGVVPTLAYNLILPMLFSFTGLGAFSLAFNLVERGERPDDGRLAILPSGDVSLRPIAAGLIAAALCVVLGNLGEVGVMVDAWQRASDTTIQTGIGAVDTLVRIADGGFDVVLGGRPAPIGTGDWFWTATRAINARPGEVAPITEFPYFTFLYADLHAHMIALPLALLALGWAVALALQGTERRAGAAATWLQWLVGGVAIGSLRATNTWDLPTYLLLGALAVAFHVYRQHGRLTMAAAGQAGLQSVALVAVAVLAFLPFAQNYGVGYASFSLWPGSHTHLKNYLVIYGLFLFLVVTHLGREFRDWSAGWTPEGLARLEPVARPLLLALGAYVVLLVVLLWRSYWIAPLALTLAAVAGLLSLRPGLPAPRRVALALIGISLTLTLFVEMFVLDGDIGRMNTVFKFYMQVWVMLSVVGGAAAMWAWPAVTRRWGRTARRAWQAGLAALLLAALLYPVLATRARWQVRMSQSAPATLDGMIFMKTTEYGDRGQTIYLEHDYEALQWMVRNIEGSPVVAEAHSDNPYRSIGNRVSMYTGLPTIIGWDWHQRQQRAVLPGNLVGQRIEHVNTLFSTTDIGLARQLLDRYGVEYIYVGQLEQVYYGALGLEKFERMVEMGLLRPVYDNEMVRIYEVIYRDGSA